MSTIGKNIDKIRSAYGQLTQEDQQVLAGWEKSIKKSEMYRSWCKMPVTQEIFKRLERDLAALTIRLSTEEELSEVDRRAIFMVKPVLLYLLSIPRATEQQISTLEADVQERMKDIENTQSNLPNYN